MTGNLLCLSQQPLNLLVGLELCGVSLMSASLKDAFERLLSLRACWLMSRLIRAGL